MTLSQPSAASVTDRLLSDAIMVGSLAAIYALFQYSIGPDWPAWIIAPGLLLAWRFVFLRARAADRVPGWLTTAAVMLVSFAAIYTPLQWLIRSDWPAWIWTPFIIFVGWLLLSLLSIDDDDG